jgi:hypothetical protein
MPTQFPYSEASSHTSLPNASLAQQKELIDGFNHSV